MARWNIEAIGYMGLTILDASIFCRQPVATLEQLKSGCRALHDATTPSRPASNEAGQLARATRERGGGSRRAECLLDRCDHAGEVALDFLVGGAASAPRADVCAARSRAALPRA